MTTTSSTWIFTSNTVDPVKYDLTVSDVITADKKSMVADSFVLWEISDPLRFIQTLSGSVANAEYRIDTIVYNSLKTVISSMKQEDVISGRDGELAAQILENVGDKFSEYGITVFAIETKRIDLPDENKSAVYERMISERENIAARYVAEGEAEYMRILSAAYDTPEEADFYEFLRALDMAETALAGGNKTLVVSADSPIAKVFAGNFE